MEKTIKERHPKLIGEIDVSIGRVYRRIAVICSLPITLYFVTGCAFVAGTPEGLRTVMDGANGLVAQGKAGPNKQGAYFNHRVIETRERTKRAYAPGFLDALFQRQSATVVNNNGEEN
jgi:hypothetical protein